MHVIFHVYSDRLRDSRAQDEAEHRYRRRLCRLHQETRDHDDGRRHDLRPRSPRLARCDRRVRNWLVADGGEGGGGGGGGGGVNVRSHSVLHVLWFSFHFRLMVALRRCDVLTEFD